MDIRRCTAQRLRLLGIAGLALAVLAGCSGNDGAAGPAGTTSVQTVTASSTTGLNIAVTGVSVASPPVINFRVTDQYGNAATGLTANDLRFTFAKLTPGANGDPSTWQNYLNTTATGAFGTATQGTREGGTTGAFAGTLVDNGDGTYKYTFKTDVTNVTSPLAVTYNPGLTHRVGIQTRGTLPLANAVYTFRPSDGATTGIYQREIVKTAKCNECHNVLQAHDQRIETKYCVTCHNPGSSDPDTGNTVDFKVMIHKIHRGSSLPSVVAGGSYQIIGFGGAVTDFSTVAFPQDIRNCTKCHDGADASTSQGDNWKTQPSKEACGSCHDNVNFTTGINHPGGIQTSNSTCYGCHSAGGAAGPVETSHANPAKLARGKFQFNVLEICGTAVANKPLCAPGTTPTVKFSVTDPSGATTHGYGNKYSLFADPEFWNSATSAARGSMSVDIAWDTRDYGNTGGYAARPARANQVNVFGTTASSTNYGNASIAAYARATDNGDGTYTVTALGPIPDGTVFPNVAASGSGAVAIEGRAFNPQSGLSATDARVPVKGAVAYFRITDATPTARRVVADATAKCDNCHDQLSLHGGSRNDNVQLCVICHNPNNTDAQASARTKFLNGLPNAGVIADGKKEESIDLKRMIHGIHAGATKSLNGATTLFGFRNKGLWVSGTDFSGVRFPGILNDCTACHSNTTATSGIGTYELTGTWDTPTQNSILGSTVDSTPGLTSGDASATVNAALQNPVDDLNISPTAAVCSSCHDSTLSQSHMAGYGALFSATQATISSGATLETCAVCHGPGRTADVKTVHSIK
jgi:OmcA/MtrC family decaheme c-type cytochrome